MRFLTRKQNRLQALELEFIVRPVELGDAQQIAALRKRVDKDKKNKNPPLDPYGVDYPRLEQQRSEIAACQKDGIFYVALSQEQIIGCSSSSEDYGCSGEYGLGIAVDREWHEKGVEFALVSQIVTWAKSRSEIEKLVCRFARADKSTKRLLKKFGFEVFHEGRVYYMQAAMYNQTEMVLKLK